MSQTGKRSSIYHEIETSGLNKYLLNAKGGKYGFQVKCSKAILNCLLQREEFKKDVKVVIGYTEVNILYERLKLRNHFKTNVVEQWLEEKGKILGSILAISQALSTISVEISPVEELTYTALVENPSAYICWMQNGWIILRKIKDNWFVLDPRAPAPEQISGTYFHLIIGQLMAEKELIFRVSGGEFAPPYQRVDGSAHRTYPHSLLPRAALPLYNPPDEKYLYLEQITCSEQSSAPTTSAPDRSDGPGPTSRNSSYSRRVATRVQNNSETKSPRSSNTTKPRDISPHSMRVNEMKYFLSELSHLRISRALGKGSRVEENTSLMTSNGGQIKRSDSSGYERPQAFIPVWDKSTDWQHQRTRQSRKENEANTNRRLSNRSQSVARVGSDRQTSTPFECDWPTLEQANQREQRNRRGRSRSEARNRQRGNHELYRGGPSSSSTDVQQNKCSTSKSTPEQNTTGKETDKQSSCCICMDAHPEIAFIPCGHMCICASCCQSFRNNESKCPICRKLIVSSLKVFTS